jgi:hypothetical protein
MIVTTPKDSPESSHSTTHTTTHSAASDPDVDEWADREHKRRQAWLNGPTETEKRAWARRYRGRYGAPRFEDPYDYDVYEASDQDVEKWAAREHRRRQAWASGPTEAEREDFAIRTAPRQSSYGPVIGDDYYTSYTDSIDRMRREAYLAAEGAWSWLTDTPYRLWSELTDAGRAWESGYGMPSRRRRVSLYDY